MHILKKYALYRAASHHRGPERAREPSWASRFHSTSSPGKHRKVPFCTSSQVDFVQHGCQIEIGIALIAPYNLGFNGALITPAGQHRAVDGEITRFHRISIAVVGFLEQRHQLAETQCISGQTANHFDCIFGDGRDGRFHGILLGIQKSFANLVDVVAHVDLQSMQSLYTRRVCFASLFP